MREVKNWLTAFVLALIPTILVWLPFYTRLPVFWNIPLPQRGMETIVTNYDGPLYMVVAKSLYNPAIIKSFEFSLPVEYYAAHFPLYPLLIRLLGQLTQNHVYAPLAITTLSSALAIYFFFKLISMHLKDRDAFFATFVFSFFPARWLVVRSVGSPEPLFVAAIIASIYFFQNRKYWLAALAGSIACITKSPGILLFVAYFLSLVIPQLKELPTSNFKKWLTSLNWRAYPLIVMPLSLLGVFAYYRFVFDNFWAYFNSGDNIHLFFPPFQIFNYSASWVGTFWLEEVIFVYLLASLGLANLIRQKETTLAWFVGVFLTTIFFVSHRDIIRYALPIIPFLFVAFKDTLTKKEFKYVSILVIVPVYLFTLAFISQNTMQISNWTPFL